MRELIIESILMIHENGRRLENGNAKHKSIL
jgi:hypothetical protein